MRCSVPRAGIHTACQEVNPETWAVSRLLREAGIGAFFRSSRLEEAGLSRLQLPMLLRSGAVERFARGLCRRSDAEPTENYSLAMACARVPNSIVCLLTALRVHEIGTQAPAAIWLAIPPHKARAPRLQNLKVRLVRFSGPAWTFGVQKTSFEGVPARITSPACTIIADCFRFERLVGTEAALKALQDGLRSRKATIAELVRVQEGSALATPARRAPTGIDMSLDIAASVKARLLAGARAEGGEFERTLVRYAAERLLYRIGASEARQRCLLKGACLLAVWLAEGLPRHFGRSRRRSSLMAGRCAKRSRSARFDEIGERIIGFLGPVRASILAGTPFDRRWVPPGLHGPGSACETAS